MSTASNEGCPVRRTTRQHLLPVVGIVEYVLHAEFLSAVGALEPSNLVQRDLHGGVRSCLRRRQSAGRLCGFFTGDGASISVSEGSSQVLQGCAEGGLATVMQLAAMRLQMPRFD